MFECLSDSNSLSSRCKCVCVGGGGGGGFLNISIAGLLLKRLHSIHINKSQARKEYF